MKKLLLAGSLSLVLNAQIINIANNWQLVGAKEDINTSVFDNSCVDFVWGYDSKNSSWKLHIANGKQYNLPNNISALTTIKDGEGFWIKGNGNCSVDSNGFVKIDELDKKVLYLSEFTPFHTPTTLEMYRINLEKGKLELYNEDTKQWIDDGINLKKIDDYTIVLGGDVSLKINFIKLPNGAYILANSSEAQNQSYYIIASTDKKTLEDITQKELSKSDAVRITNLDEIKHQKFYILDISNDYNLGVTAFSLEDNGVIYKYYSNGLNTNVTKTGEEQYKFENGVFFDDYDSNNKSWDKNFVYKIPLAGKTLDSKLLAQENMFDSDKLVNYLKDNNLPTTFKFNKGNIYCEMLWWQCWMDKDGIDNLIDDIKK